MHTTTLPDNRQLLFKEKKKKRLKINVIITIYKLYENNSKNIKYTISFVTLVIFMVWNWSIITMIMLRQYYQDKVKGL